ncbi:hypothetical protein [Priestia megaterium]|uniref:hypothetical protein n=1 Tax=Priestia megaterium TaxID=1404 RepID=UPI003100EB1A
MKMEEALYEEWGHKIIPSSTGELNGQKRYYRIFYGLVHWKEADPENYHKACIPFVQYGTTSDFKLARRKKEIREKYPCHILSEDLPEVLAAMSALKAEFDNTVDI